MEELRKLICGLNPIEKFGNEYQDYMERVPRLNAVSGLYRYRRQIDAESVRIFANIAPEFASPLGNRSVAQRAKSAVVSSLVDVLLVSGPMAGAEPDFSMVQDAKEAVAMPFRCCSIQGLKPAMWASISAWRMALSSAPV